MFNSRLAFLDRGTDVFSLVFSNDDKNLLAGLRFGYIHIYDAADGHCVHKLQNSNQAQTLDISFDKTGKYFVTGSGDPWSVSAKPNAITVWDYERGEQFVSLEVSKNPSVSVAFTHDSKNIVFTDGNVVGLWEAFGTQKIKEFSGHAGRVFKVCISNNGKCLLTSSFDHTARLWDIETGKEIITFKGHNSALISANFSPDDKLVVTGGTDKLAKIWNAETAEEIVTLKGHKGYISSVSFSPDGKYVLTASRDCTAKLWDVESGQELFTSEGHSAVINKAVFSNDGNKIATCSNDRTVNIFMKPS